MRILMGMPDSQSLGGPAACEPPFVAELRRLGAEVAEETYVYGERLGKTTLWQRVVRVHATARRLGRVLRETEFDLVHLNTSFDRMALLRDAATLWLARDIEVYEENVRLDLPRVTAVRVSLPSDRSFVAFDTALAAEDWEEF